MSGDFDAALVRLLNGRGKLFARDVHVGLERSSAQIGPIVDQSSRLVRPSEFVHLRREGAWPFEIWPGDMNLRPDELASVNQFLKFEIRVWLDAASRTNCGYARRKIETRKAEALLNVDGHRSAAA